MKKIIVCCDGTWQDSDNGYKVGSVLGWNEPGHLAVPSNVTRICRLIKQADSAGTPQLVSNQAGLGTGLGSFDHLLGGGVGLGLSENIREAYGFLVNNYSPGDQIFLVGFSRGAFTARSTAGFISQIGILKKCAMESFYAIFLDYQHSSDPKYVGSGGKPFSNRPLLTDPSYKAKLGELGLSDVNVSIEAVGVWDTVGSLGIPETGIGKIFRPFGINKDYQFHDTKLSNAIKNAFQALALDEERGPFSPTMWEKPPGTTTNLSQVWFPGVHSNCGGGLDDPELSDITLTWMLQQLSQWLDFDGESIERQYSNTDEAIKAVSKPVPLWACGFIPNSFKFPYRAFWKSPRQPGNYSNDKTGKLLLDTNEQIHPSVRFRFFHGKGVENNGPYRSQALVGWSLVQEATGFEWRYTGRKKLDRSVLDEAKLGPVELKLLSRYPGAVQRYEQNSTG